MQGGGDTDGTRIAMIVFEMLLALLFLTVISRPLLMAVPRRDEVWRVHLCRWTSTSSAACVCRSCRIEGRVPASVFDGPLLPWYAFCTLRLFL